MVVSHLNDFEGTPEGVSDEAFWIRDPQQVSFDNVSHHDERFACVVADSGVNRCWYVGGTF